jgi:RES domain-containing protein
MIYTAESRALAMLEVAVHLDLSEDLPTDRYIIEMEISDDAEMLEVRKEDLPDSWSDFPPNLFTQSIGDEFVRRNEALVLKVPSCIVPDEFNYLINPNHKSINEVQVVDTIKVGFDGRLGGRKV